VTDQVSGDRLLLPPPFDLRGRTVLVTGAGSPVGIGFATARLLGSMGARVAVTATSDRVHDRAAELSGAGVDALAVVADLTDESAVRALVDRVGGRLGEISVLVNNAGMTSQARPVLGETSGGAESGTLLELAPDAWRESLARNLDTAYLVTRAVLPGMIAAPWGRIVMVASVTGPAMAMRGETAYAAAKAGMVGLARAVAVDHGPDGITCNAVAPGWITTASQTTDEVRQAGSTPVRRAGTPDEVATAVVLLCTPGAGYLTGQVILVDGGNSVAEERAT
jgi:3-oxoacyl-[acyl-carrier protein] reductase